MLRTALVYVTELVGFGLVAYAVGVVFFPAGVAVAGAELVLIAQAARR